MPYSENQLAKLWVKAGGPPKLANLMAKIALRESGGRAHINNAGTNKDGSVDYGLFQINSVHGYNPSKLYNPLYNAKAAVSVYRKQGLHAWSTYNPSIDKKYIGEEAKQASAAKATTYKGASPVAAADDTRKQLALSLLGFGNFAGSYGSDPLTTALLAAAQANRKAPKAAAKQSAGYGTTPAASGSYPLGKRGKLIGTPFSGTHAVAFNRAGGSDNWQSERAVDISVPIGTPVYAEESGVLGNTGSLGQGGRFAGLRTNLVGKSNSYYYAHLSKLAPGIRAGAHVKKGQLLGYTGEANGVPHLHFAVEKGDPRKYVK